MKKVRRSDLPCCRIYAAVAPIPTGTDSWAAAKSVGSMRRLTPPRRASSSKLLSFNTSTRPLRKSAMLTLLFTGFGALALVLTLYEEELLRRILRRSQWGFAATMMLLLLLLLPLWALDTVDTISRSVSYSRIDEASLTSTFNLGLCCKHRQPVLGRQAVVFLDVLGGLAMIGTG